MNELEKVSNLFERFYNFNNSELFILFIIIILVVLVFNTLPYIDTTRNEYRNGKTIA